MHRKVPQNADSLKRILSFDITFRDRNGEQKRHKNKLNTTFFCYARALKSPSKQATPLLLRRHLGSPIISVHIMKNKLQK